MAGAAPHRERGRFEQKLNDICRSMVRLAAGEEKKPPASAVDLPNSGDWSTPTGCARLTALNTLRAMAANVREYRRGTT